METEMEHTHEEFDRVLAPGEAIAFTVEPGWRLRLYQVQERQVADLVSFALDDPDDRLSMYMSRAVNLTWKLTQGHLLISTDGRDLRRPEFHARLVTCDDRPGGPVTW